MGNLYDARENRKMQQVKTTPYLFLQMVQFQKSKPLKNINNDTLKFPMAFLLLLLLFLKYTLSTPNPLRLRELISGSYDFTL